MKPCNPTQFLALRMFMGLQMIAVGIHAHFTSRAIHPDFIESGTQWLWILNLIIGGISLVVLVLLELYLGSTLTGLGTVRRRRLVKVVHRYGVVSLFFCGAVWGGIGWGVFTHSNFELSDIMSPLYVAFLLFLAFKDACKKRERVLRNT
jgi:hypothetical protein